jgi:hypothetical protein
MYLIFRGFRSGGQKGVKNGRSVIVSESGTGGEFLLDGTADID